MHLLCLRIAVTLYINMRSVSRVVKMGDTGVSVEASHPWIPAGEPLLYGPHLSNRRRRQGCSQHCSNTCATSNNIGKQVDSRFPWPGYSTKYKTVCLYVRFFQTLIIFEVFFQLVFVCCISWLFWLFCSPWSFGCHGREGMQMLLHRCIWTAALISDLRIVIKLVAARLWADLVNSGYRCQQEWTAWRFDWGFRDLLWYSARMLLGQIWDRSHVKSGRCLIYKG